jgi:hypothetical protein
MRQKSTPSQVFLHPTDESARLLTLTNQRVAVIDAVDAERILALGLSWYAFRVRRSWYAAAEMGATGNRRRVYLHRLIMDAPIGIEVDHRDGDGLNCRRSNLRLCSHAQNLANQRLSSANKSGYRGVSWDMRDRRWRVAIKKHQVVTTLGGFKDPISAALAYDKAAREMFGEFARLNFPNEGERQA